MHRIDVASAVTVMPSIGAAGPKPNGYWTAGNPGTGTPATVLDQDFFNALQEELAAIVLAAGLTLTKSDTNQVLDAINTLIANAVGGISIPDVPSYIDDLARNTLFQQTAAPVYASATTVTVPSIRCRDGANTVDLVKTGSTTVNLGTTGLNALDTGTRAANTFYYFYAIGKADETGTGLVASTVNESVSGSITLPSGYTKKRQLPFFVRTDGSNNILPFRVGAGWPFRPEIWYEVIINDDSVASDTRILASGTATSFTAVSAANYLPPISRMGIFKPTMAVNTASHIRLRPTGGNGYIQQYVWAQREGGLMWCGVNSSQSLDYLVSASTWHIAVAGAIVTEVI